MGKKTKRFRNLKPFQPGQSGNPKGRPPEPLILKDLRAACKAADKAGVIFDALMKLVEKGNVKAIELMAHYGAGKPADTVHMGVASESYEDLLRQLKEQEASVEEPPTDAT